MPRNTIFAWLLSANKKKIMAAFSSGIINLKRKNVKAGKYEELDKAIFKWFMSARSRHTTNILVLQDKANDFVKKLDIANYKASKGWLDSRRHEIMSSLKQDQKREIFHTRNDCILERDSLTNSIIKI